MISKDLTSNIIKQHHKNNSNANATYIKNEIKEIKLQQHQGKLSKLQNNLNDNQRRLLELNQEQVASSWLNTLQIPGESYDVIEMAILASDLDQIRVGSPKDDN